MFSGFFGWHLLLIVGTVVLLGLLVWGAYWVAGRAARVPRDVGERDRRQAP